MTRLAPPMLEQGYVEGKLPKYSSVGCYPLYYACETEYYGWEVRCPDCANGEPENEGDKIVACDANWEDPDMFCDCGERIESAYAEDEVSS